MRLRVTLQLPDGPPEPLVELPCARVLLIGRGYVASALEPHLVAAGAQVEHTSRNGSEGSRVRLGCHATTRSQPGRHRRRDLRSSIPRRDGSRTGRSFGCGNTGAVDRLSVRDQRLRRPGRAMGVRGRSADAGTGAWSRARGCGTGVAGALRGDTDIPAGRDLWSGSQSICEAAGRLGTHHQRRKGVAWAIW